MSKKKFKDTFVGRTLKGIFREGLQSIPVIGTIVTNMKEDTKENPAGKIKLSKWDVFRMVAGAFFAYLLANGWALEKVEFLSGLMGF